MAETRTTSSTGGQKGTKLARFDLIPIGPLTALAEHFGKGARKYADHQWRNGYEWSKSYSALQRHLTAFWAGYDYDVCSNDPDGCSHVDADGNPFEAAEPDTCFNHTGSHHMAAVAWHAFALLEFIEEYPEHDDRHKREPEIDTSSLARTWTEDYDREHKVGACATGGIQVNVEMPRKRRPFRDGSILSGEAAMAYATQGRLRH